MNQEGITLADIENEVLAIAENGETGRIMSPESMEETEGPITQTAREEESDTTYALNLNFGGAGGTQVVDPNALSEEDKIKRLMIGGAITLFVMILLVIAISYYKRKNA